MATSDTGGAPFTKNRVPDSALHQLEAELRGSLIRAGHPEYDTARKVHNAMIDRFPLAIARCTDVADVSACVDFVRQQALTVSVRGGGHNVAGSGVCDGGLVIDLSRMRSIRVDPEARTARVEGGCTWGDVDHATHKFGLATPGGVVSTTGVAGLTLGGGMGHLTRKYGLSCDNLISADVVTADGQLLKVSADRHADLFWALRGGGGNFGVVTSFEFRLHPLSTVVGGPVLWRLEQAADAMRFYRDYMNQAPDDMSAFFAFLIVPPAPPFPAALHNQTVCGVVTCYAGPLERADEVMKPLRQFGPPLFAHVGQMPFPMLQSAFDALVPPGLQNYWKADYVLELTDEVIAGHLRFGPGVPTVNTAMHIYPVSGAAQRVDPHDTAYSYRDAKYVHVIAAIYPDPADTPKHRQWVRDYWAALHPFSAGGAYVNFMMDEGEERIRATYRDNYERLATIKSTYDPTNLFHINQNIKPA